MKSFTASVFSVIAMGVKSAEVFDIENTIKETIKGLSPEDAELVFFENERGRPMMHAAVDDECHGAHHLCSHGGKPVIKQTGHHVRAETNQPIFGILTQPIPDQWKQENPLFEQNGYTSYFEASHVDYLQAAGARTVHIDYKASQHKILEELEQLNGLYIPGDGVTTLSDPEFILTVATLLGWAQSHNQDTSEHFPVVAESFGFMALLRSQMRDSGDLIAFEDYQKCTPLEQNLNLMPSETYTYDEVEVRELEKVLDKVKFHNDLDVGVPLERFIESKGLRTFVPVATYNRSTEQHRLDEMVSTIEGTVLPIFGFAHRLDKVQFGLDNEDGVDHSKISIEHAQHVANLIVDEARLSNNQFEWSNEENRRLITNYDVQRLTLVPDNSCSTTERMMELYLF